MNAIIETGGKQYRVAVGDKIEIEKLEQEVGAQVSFPVLMTYEGEAIQLGRPVLETIQVTGEIITQKKGPKLIAYTYRKRKGSERKVGHRQPLTVVKITEIKG